MFTQREVVFGGTAFVAIAFNLHTPALLLDELGSLRQCLLRIRTELGFVIVKVNVLDHLGEELIVSDRRCRNGSWRWCRRWRRYGDLCRCVLRSACAFRGEVIRGGLCWRNGLRT